MSGGTDRLCSSVLRSVLVCIFVVLAKGQEFLTPTELFTDLALNKNITVTNACSGNTPCEKLFNGTLCMDLGVCVVKCPDDSRTDFPAANYPISTSVGFCGYNVTLTSTLPPAATAASGVIHFNQTSGDCAANTSIAQKLYFTLSFWVQGICTNCQIIRLLSSSSEILKISLQSTKLFLNNNNETDWPTITETNWTHVVFRKSRNDSLFIDGLKQMLTLSVTEVPNILQLGPDNSVGANDSVTLADMRFYSDDLTDREIKSLFNGNLDNLPELSLCRCPSGYPVVNANGAICTNGPSQKDRLQLKFNAPTAAVDGNLTTAWASTSTGNVSIIVSLDNTFQVTSIDLNFNSEGGLPNSALWKKHNKGTSQNMPAEYACNNKGCKLNINVTKDNLPEALADKIEVTFSGRQTNTSQVQNIILTNLAVSGRCNCNGHSNNCSRPTGSSDYKCLCEASHNKEGIYCEKCKKGFYRNKNDFTCPKECSCSSSGVTNDTCQEIGGQCNCQTNVEGLNCTDCKDSFYNTKGSIALECTKCGCHMAGSITQVCDKKSGQCACRNGRPNRDCKPVVISTGPLFGPEKGETVVTIKGSLLKGNGSGIEPVVLLEGTRQEIITKQDTMIQFKTNTLNTSNKEPMLTLNWTNVNDVGINLGKFVYKPNPALNRGSLPTVNTYVSGGCNFSYQGLNLKNVYQPKFKVMLSTENQTSTVCHVSGPSLMICPTPNVFADGKYNLTIELDGVHVSLPQISVTKDPDVDEIGIVDFKYPFVKSISFQGKRLKSACHINDFKAMIGKSECRITRFSDTEITCEPPSSPPSDAEKFDITVEVGNWKKVIGELYYKKFWQTEYFVYIMVGVAVFVILVIAAIIGICICRHRRKRRSMDTESSDTKFHALSPNNHSDELPLTECQPIGVPNAADNPAYVSDVMDVVDPTDVITKENFLHRLEENIRQDVKSCIISFKDFNIGTVCTAKGTRARRVEGSFKYNAKKNPNQKLTIKMLIDPLPEHGVLPQWAMAALRESLRLRKLLDDNVVSIFGIGLDKKGFYILYPFMENRTLKEHISDQNKEFVIRQLLEFSLQAADGMEFLSSKDVVHKDLAARNCMVDSSELIKISDASFSHDFYPMEYTYDSARNRYLPVRWMAPESLMTGYYDTKTDVWSFGVLVWELLTRGYLPFQEVDDTIVKDYVSQGYRLGKPHMAPDEMYELMSLCWSPDSDYRPAFTNIVQQIMEMLTDKNTGGDDLYVNSGPIESIYVNTEDLRERQANQNPSFPPQYGQHLQV